MALSTAVAERIDRICALVGVTTEVTTQHIPETQITIDGRLNRISELIAAGSSFIEAYDYNSDGRVFLIKFRNNHNIYCYLGVPYFMFEDFVRAASKGKYFNLYIRGLYKFVECVRADLG